MNLRSSKTRKLCFCDRFCSPLTVVSRLKSGRISMCVFSTAMYGPKSIYFPLIALVKFFFSPLPFYPPHFNACVLSILQSASSRSSFVVVTSADTVTFVFFVSAISNSLRTSAFGWFFARVPYGNCDFDDMVWFRSVGVFVFWLFLYDNWICCICCIQHTHLNLVEQKKKKKKKKEQFHLPTGDNSKDLERKKAFKGSEITWPTLDCIFCLWGQLDSNELNANPNLEGGYDWIWRNPYILPRQTSFAGSLDVHRLG